MKSATKQVQAGVIDQIILALDEEGLTRADLARKWGKSRSYVTQLLKNNKLLTVRVCVEIGQLLNRNVDIRFVKRG